MGGGDLVALECAADTLRVLAADLESFGPSGGEPEWLVSGAWLCTNHAQFLATPSVEVRSDGFVARPLTIQRPTDFARKTDAELPDIQARLTGRGNGLELPPSAEPKPRPDLLRPWPAGPYSTGVVVRPAMHRTTHHVACALLFSGEAKSMLVGTDVTSMALVIGEVEDLIQRYIEGCEILPVADYLDSLDG